MPPPTVRARRLNRDEARCVVVETQEHAIAELVAAGVTERRTTADGKRRIVAHDVLVNRQHAGIAASVAVVRLADAEVARAGNVLAGQQGADRRLGAWLRGAQTCAERENAGQRIGRDLRAGHYRQQRREAERHGVAGLVGRVEQVPQDLADRRFGEPAFVQVIVRFHVDAEIGLHAVLRIAIDGSAERHPGERVAPAFTEGDAQIEQCRAAAVDAADGIGAPEAILDVVAELVRDHRLVELVGVAAERREVAEDVDAVGVGLRHSAVVQLARPKHDVAGRADVAVVGTESPDGRPILIAPEQAQCRERGGGRRSQHELLRTKHGIQDRERRCRSLTRVAVHAEAARRIQVARAVRGTAARRAAVQCVERIGVVVVVDREIPGRRGTRLDHLRAHADEQARVRRHAQRIVAARIRTGRGKDCSAGGSADRLHGDLSRGCLNRAGRVEPVAERRIEGNTVERDLPGDRNARGRRLTAPASATATCRKQQRPRAQRRQAIEPIPGIANSWATRHSGPCRAGRTLPQGALGRKPSTSPIAHLHGLSRYNSSGPSAIAASCSRSARTWFSQ